VNDLFVSTRRVFRRGDPNWDIYVEWVRLPFLHEVRTLDRGLNDYVDRCGSTYCSVQEIDSTLETLPAPQSPQEYNLLAIRSDAEVRPAQLGRWNLLGYDLCDQTMISSLLNCGPWTGLLAPFVEHLNAFGLLTLEAAQAARHALPQEWGDSEPHAHASAWALFERRG